MSKVVMYGGIYVKDVNLAFDNIAQARFIN